MSGKWCSHSSTKRGEESFFLDDRDNIMLAITSQDRNVYAICWTAAFWSNFWMYKNIKNIIERETQKSATVMFASCKYASRYTVTQYSRESVGLCPFHGLYVREFKLSHSNPVSRIHTIHAHNLHVKMLDFFPFTIHTYFKIKVGWVWLCGWM